MDKLSTAESTHRTSAGKNWRWRAAIAFILAMAAGVGILLVDRERTPHGAEPSASAPARADSPLSAEFALPNGRIVVLDYLDSGNFQLTDQASATETLVVNGEIYLHFPEREGRPERLWRYGKLVAGPSSPPMQRRPALRPTLIPPQGVAVWGDVGEVHDVEVRSSGPLGVPIDATVARLPELANAQWQVATRLLPAMNMSLCGDGVQQLTSWWDPELTGDGWAIMASSAGIRLNGTITHLSRKPALPAGVDARSLPAQSEW